MSALECSTSNSPFGISYTAAKRTDKNTTKSGDEPKNGSTVSGRNPSYNKWSSASSNSWGKTNLHASNSLGSENSLRNNSKQLSVANTRQNGTIKARASSFENGISSESSADKPVLRRWQQATSTVSEEEAQKGRKPVSPQGQKFKFKPVVSLLSRTPWQNDFVKRSNSLKLKSDSSLHSEPPDNQNNSSGNSDEIKGKDGSVSNNATKQSSHITINGNKASSRHTTRTSVTVNGSSSNDHTKNTKSSDENSQVKSSQVENTTDLNGNRASVGDATAFNNRLNGNAFDHNQDYEPADRNNTPDSNRGHLTRSSASTNSNIWIKRHSQELDEDKSPSVIESENLNTSPSAQETSPSSVAEEQTASNQDDMSYSSRSYYSSARSSAFKSAPSASFDAGSYRTSSRNRAGSPERSRHRYGSPERSINRISSPERGSYRSTGYDAPATTRYSSTSSYSGYSKKTFDLGDDDVYSSRVSSTRGYQTPSSRDLSSTSSSYKSSSRDPYVASPAPSYRSYRKDSYEGTTSSKPSDSSSYETGKYEGRKYSGSRSTEVEPSSSSSSTRKGSFGDSYSKSRYTKSLSRQESGGYNIAEVDETYSSKYAAYKMARGQELEEFNGTGRRSSYDSSKTADVKYGDSSNLASKGSFYSSRNSTGRRYSEDLSHTSEVNPDGFEKSSFIRRSLRLGKTREKSEDREADDQSLSRLSRLRSSLKWSHSKDKEDEPKKDRADDIRRDSTSSFLKRSSKKKSKGTSDGLSNSRPTSPSSDSDRALSPDITSSELSPTSKKKLDDKKDKVSFFKRLRKSSRGHEEDFVSASGVDKQVRKNSGTMEPKVSVGEDDKTDVSRVETEKPTTSTADVEVKEAVVSVEPEKVEPRPVENASPKRAPPLGQPETDLEALEMWSKSIEQDILDLDTAIHDIETKDMGNVVSEHMEESCETISSPSKLFDVIREHAIAEPPQKSDNILEKVGGEISTTEKVTLEPTKEDKATKGKAIVEEDIITNTRVEESPKTKTDGSLERKIDDAEVLRSLNAPSKALPKREEVVDKDTKLISSKDVVEPVIVPEMKSKANGVLESYVIVDETSVSAKTSTDIQKGDQVKGGGIPTVVVEPAKEIEKNGVTPRSKFVRTHGSAKDRIREKKLRKEQEEQLRAIIAAKEEAKAAEEARTVNGDQPLESTTKTPDMPVTEPPTPTAAPLTPAAVPPKSAAAAEETIKKEEEQVTKTPEKSTDTMSKPVEEIKGKSPKGKKRVLRRSRTLATLPHAPEPELPPKAQDDGAVMKREKKIIRPRPRTLTQGIDPSLILAQGKTEDEDSGVVEEKQLSLKQLQMKFLSGDFEKKTKTQEKKEKQKEEKKTKVKRSRSGKRYKTITEGIAPGILDAARHLSDQQSDVEERNSQNEELSRLTAALSASTQDIKRKSYLVGENGSVPNSRTGSLATSVEDLSRSMQQQRTDALDTSKARLGDIGRKQSQEGEVLSLSAMKDRFLKAVVETEAKHKQKSFLRVRRKSSAKERPHTICGIDDWTMQQIQGSIAEAAANKPEPIKSESVDIEDKELEEICKLEGLSPEELAAELGCDPALNATSYEKNVHRRHSKALEEIRQKRKEEEVKKPEPVPEPGVPKVTRKNVLTVEDTETKKQRKSGVFEPIDIMKLAVTAPAKEEEVEQKKEEETPHTEEKKIVLDGTESDLDFVSHHSSQLSNISAGKRHLKPQRKHRTGANPLKALNKREDLVDEAAAGQQTKKVAAEDQGSGYRAGTGMAQKSVGQQLWRKVALASEAKSALKSIEDFSSVKLRKVKPPEERKKDEIESFQGSKVSNILIQVKGRRHVQCRVVEFSVSAFDSGDSFVIVTPTSLHCWHGKQANVIEKAKAAEIASRIQQKKEMGCKALDVVYYEQGGPGEERVFRPFGLETVPKVAPSDVLMLDEDYEKNMIMSNMVYTVQQSDPPELVPFLEMCHKMPSKEILKTDEAFVFDFITELYVWIGRQTTSVLRKTIQNLAKAKFDAGYFKPSVVSSYAHLHGRARKISLKTEAVPHGRKGSTSRRVSLQKQMHDKESLAPRPAHSIILVMFEGAEWVIFREKFCDWPDESRIIRMKGGPQARGEMVKAPKTADIKVLNPEQALASEIKPQTYVFEGTAIERGQGRPYLGIEGYHIVTKEVQIWFVTEHKHYLLPTESNGQFHSGEGYVIRWEYSVVPERVMRTLSDKSQASTMGRQKCAYFFWLGNDCSVTEQAATAVMTVELDKEKGPQIRVLQGKEPPCLLNIFNGGMIIHAGKRPLPGVRKNFTDRSLIRLYCVRNELPNEACLLQVPVSSESLRSRSSYILLLCGQGEIFVWHGCKVSEGTRNSAMQAAHRLVEMHPAEASLANKTEIGINILEEGHEPEVFWVALGGEEDYGSLLLDLNTPWDFTPRLFQLTSATGEFIAHEVACPSISQKYACPFPFLQDDLYNTDQPSIFLLDVHNEVYLWLGWWPDDDEGDVTSSMYTRWDIDKRKAMESAILYSQAAGRPLTHTYVVYAGLEPDSFIWLFPYWIVQEDITDIQLEEGREQEEKILITEELEMFSKDTYTLEELRVRPLPQGVNPTRLESYLSDEDFKELFQMERDEFLQLPTWKKANIKKKVGLY